MEMYDFENMKVAAHKNYQIKANWKVTLENYQECYHCAPSHPEYALMHTLKVDEDKFDALQGKMLSRMDACGVKHMEIDQQFTLKEKGQEQYAYSRYALFEKYKTGSESGEPVAPLLGQLKGFDHGASDISIGPLTYYLAYNDHVVVYVFTPTGHETSQCDLYWLVRGDAIEGKDYNVEDLTWLWHVTILADERIITDNQNGINSKMYEPGPLAKMEYIIDRYADWYLDALEL
jgi:Rieske 2Fe-2S family protein